MILNILLALLVLNIMVIAHEFGHYLLARRNGILVDEFAIGFGPTLFKKKWLGTLWMIKAFPLGGYNGLKGETEEEAGIGNFSTASKKAKLQVLLAGSAMNVALAVISFYIALGLYGWKVPVPLTFNPIGAEITAVGDKYPLITAIIKDSPMSTVEMKLPAQVLSVNGTQVTSPSEVVSLIAKAPNDPVTLEIKDGDAVRSITVTRNQDKKIGIAIDPAPTQLDYRGSFTKKLFSGFSHVANTTILTGKMLSAMFSFVKQTGDLEPIGYAFAGPVAIVAAVGSVVKNSRTVFADLANMTGLIGVSLAMFNLLPFPGLDGWHIFLLFYEKVRGKKPNEKLVNIITGIGLLFLIGLGIVIMFKDVWMFFLRK